MTASTSGAYTENEEYTIGWFCALPGELEASVLMLDVEHKPPKPLHEGDLNEYRGGKIHGHNVVMACLPLHGGYGESAAATAVAHMKLSFPEIKSRIVLVGIAGGLPECSGRADDVRLGDVVVGMRHKGKQAVVQYDFGESRSTGFNDTGHVREASDTLQIAAKKVQATPKWKRKSLRDEIEAQIKDVNGILKPGADHFLPPNFEEDKLQHPALAKKCGHHDSPTELCDNCTIPRPKRDPASDPMIHYGTIATGNAVIKNSNQREEYRIKHGAKCCEMEAAGASIGDGCLVVRGICDYADARKSDDWQNYAALTAAAYARLVIEQIPLRSILRGVEIPCNICQYNPCTRYPRYKCPICPSSNRCGKCLKLELTVPNCPCAKEFYREAPKTNADPKAVPLKTLRNSFFIKIDKTVHCPTLANRKELCKDCGVQIREILYRCKESNCEMDQLCGACVRIGDEHFDYRDSGVQHSFWAYTLKDDEDTPGWKAGITHSDRAKEFYASKIALRTKDGPPPAKGGWWIFRWLTG